MVDPINLRLARKKKARADAEKQAAENRIVFGQTKTEKKARKAELDRTKRAFDAGRLDPEKP